MEGGGSKGTVSPRTSPLGAYLFVGFCLGPYSKGVLFERDL